MLAALVLASAWPAGCGERAPEATGGALEIAVGAAPLAWVARGLAPADARVTVLVPPGASPHGWEPTPAQAAALQSADLVLVVGLGMSPSIEGRVAGDARALVFADATGVAAEHDHAHEAGDDHDHAVDPHLWLDPALVATLVRTTHDRIAALQASRGALDDAERARLADARDAMLAEIDSVRTDGAQALAAHAGAGLVTVHDAWGRFASSFGLRIVGVLQRAGESEASAGAVAASAALVRQGDARVIVVEPQYSDVLARRVAEVTGAQVATLDPLGDGDWPAMMRANIAALTAALESAGEATE
jgi:zinc transport system substrate-binding protein